MVQKRNSENVNETYSDQDLTIEHWFVKATNQAALDAIKTTHVVHPLPAFHKDRTRMKPVEYEKSLSGAIIRLDFQLLHWDIKKPLYPISIEKMRVLIEPLPVASPKKRRVASDDESSDSNTADNANPPATIKVPPSKKARTKN